MSLRVIELNDSDVRVTGAEGLIARSPGFALVGRRGIQTGEAAEKQARLHPTQSFNKFWQSLSMEPLAHAGGGVRHFADLAYAHLLHLAELAGLKDEVLLAVPGNFTAQQLAILLGLVKQSPFDAGGMVDSALAGVAALADSDATIYVDQQLHQVLLSRFVIRNGMLQRESVIQVPGVGSQNFADLLMQLATSQFIQQCRFNPQHNAESEQLLYNELPAWLGQARDQSSSVLMELRVANAAHQAKLPGESLARKLDPYFVKIAQQVNVLSGDTASQVLVSQRLGELPGFRESFARFGEVALVSPETLGLSCLNLREHITGHGGELRFVSSIPFAGRSGQAAMAAAATEVREDPTHLLYQDWALPLGRIEINNRETVNGSAPAAGELNLSIRDLPDYLGQVERRGSEVYLLCGEAGAWLNNRRIAGRQRLFRGDRLRFAERGQELTLIRESHGQE